MFGKRVKKIRKAVSVVTAWLLLIQMIMPAVVIAEELGTIRETEEEVVVATVPPDEMEMVSGDATAQAIAETEVNTTLVGSTLETAVINVGEGDEDLVPFELTGNDATPAASLSTTEDPVATESGEIGEVTPSAITGGAEIEISNEASVAAEIVAIAETGNNNQDSETGGSSTMQTGEAVAVANSLTLVNTTLVNSQLQVGQINILSGWDGDIIIDPLTLGMNESVSWGGGIGKITIDNTGNIVIETEAEATSGNNSQTADGETQIVTGGVAAMTSSQVIAGMTVINADVMQLLVENLWLWTGQIFNWEAPGSVTPASELLASYARDGGDCQQGCGELSLAVQNSAEVVVTTKAVASTGNNTQVSSGSAEMRTGNALASATSTTLVNTTLINSRFTLLHFLLFDEWSGNLIFAYPDLVTKVSGPTEVAEGEEIAYTIEVTNVGYKRATDLQYNYQITSDEHEVGHDSGEADELMPGETIVQTVSLETTGRGGHTLTLVASVEGANTEISTNNNTAMVKTMVIGQEAASESDHIEESETVDPEVPTLLLTGGNNAVNGVYPGDGVRNDWKAMNAGPITAYEVMFVQEFYTPEGKILSQAGGPVGEIALNSTRNISFILTPYPNLQPGEYYTVSYLVGRSEHGMETRSNTVRSEIPLLSRGPSIVQEVRAAEPEEPGEAILGARDTTSTCSECQAVPWYWGVGIGSLAYFLITRKRESFAQVLRLGLTLPLAGYAGLLVTAGDCRQGLVIVGASVFCKWFLPISYGLYGGIGIGRKVLSQKLS